MVQFNAPVAEDTLGFLEANPDLHHQEVYRCETGACFAGWVALRNGAQWTHEGRRYSAQVTTPDGRQMHASYYAVELLTGVRMPDRMSNVWPDVDAAPEEEQSRAYQEISALFSADNTVEDLKTGVKALANGYRIHKDNGQIVSTRPFEETL